MVREEHDPEQRLHKKRHFLGRYVSFYDGFLYTVRYGISVSFYEEILPSNLLQSGSPRVLSGKKDKWSEQWSSCSKETG